jgi:hypothetical protein
VSYPKYPLIALLLFSCLTAPAWGQDVHLLDCGEVQFFGPTCVPDETPFHQLVRRSQSPQPSPPPAPLFSPETMARDTPPPLLKVLEEPTLENARAFLNWQQRRLARVQEVQQLLHRLTAPSPQP